MTDAIATTDLYKAAYLILQGHMVKTAPLPSGRTRFEFPASAASDSRGFEQGAVVSATLYADALRRAKKLLGRATPNTIHGA